MVELVREVSRVKGVQVELHIETCMVFVDTLVDFMIFKDFFFWCFLHSA